MPSSLSLALYLATKARRDRAADRDGGGEALSGKDLSRQPERTGQTGKARPSGPLIWMHTGRDGPGTAPRELARRLIAERDDLNFLLTTAAERRPDSEPQLISQLAPDETLPAIRRFLAHWQPTLSVWTEPDFRPALVSETAKRNIPLVLTDANTARADMQNRLWWRGVSGTILSNFRHVITGTPASAAALRKLGASPEMVEIRGFLEEGSAALPCNESDRSSMAKEIGSRPIWLAANVTLGERAAAIAAHRQAERRAHRLLMILVPEDPDTGLAWTRELAAEGLSVALRSAGQDPHVQTKIYIADIPQEMGLWYRLAPISFLGQSLEPKGGINPFEAAALGSAILHGPNVDRHAHAYARLTDAMAARLVPDADALGEAIEALLAPDIAAAMAHGAWQVCSSGAAATDRAIDLTLTLLDSIETI